MTDIKYHAIGLDYHEIVGRLLDIGANRDEAICLASSRNFIRRIDGGVYGQIGKISKIPRNRVEELLKFYRHRYSYI